jgi:Sec-independent protein translocase protein TatA
MFGIGPQELLIVGLLVLLIFGPTKATSVARDFGRFVSGAKSTVEEFKSELVPEEVDEARRTARRTVEEIKSELASHKEELDEPVEPAVEHTIEHGGASHASRGSTKEAPPTAEASQSSSSNNDEPGRGG